MPMRVSQAVKQLIHATQCGTISEDCTGARRGVDAAAWEHRTGCPCFRQPSLGDERASADCGAIWRPWACKGALPAATTGGWTI